MGTESKRFCEKCGAINQNTDKFCDVCGNPLRNISQKIRSAATGMLISATILKQRYRIVRKIGHGGFSAVYLAEDMAFNMAPRVVKEMSVESAGSQPLDQQQLQQSTEAFKQEALLLASLTHPNLPRIYDHFEEQQRWYIVMDYIDGDTLEAMLKASPVGKLELAPVLHVATQLCTVLNYLHTHQPAIIFRDLKPGNIMVTEDWHVYLIDFGIARLFKPGQSKDTSALGSPGYAAPEQYGRAQSTALADIYSFGATLHHLLSGRDPSDDPFQFPPLILDQYAAGAGLASLIQRMVSPQREQRPANVMEVKQAIQDLSFLSVNTTIFQPAQSPLNGSVIITVAPSGAQYDSINDAIKHVPEGGRIHVRPGTYVESVVLDKHVEIIGDGPRERIVLISNDASCIYMATETASIAGMTIQGSAENYFAIDIPQGRLQIKDCIITSEAYTCIGVHNSTAQPIVDHCIIQDAKESGLLIYDYGAGVFEDCEIKASLLAGVRVTGGGKPLLRRCKIYKGHESGLCVYQKGEGIFEDCEIYDNELAGVEISTGSQPLLRQCKIYHGRKSGISIYEQGEGTFEDCEIYDNTLNGVEINTQGRPLMRRCRIYNGQESGIFFYEQGEGIFEDCEIFENVLSGIRIIQEGNPTMRRCKIYKGKRSGLYIYEGGKGTFEDCKIFENMLTGVIIKGGGKPFFHRCKVYNGKESGVYVYEHGEGTFEDCEIYANTLPGIMVSEGGNPYLRQCRIHNGKENGLYIHEQGLGTFEDCRIYSNEFAGIRITSGGQPVVRRCQIYNGRDGGVLVHEEGRGIFEDCEIYANELTGIFITSGARVSFFHCKVHDGREDGIYIDERGQAIFEECEVFENKMAGIEVGARGKPLMRRCKIYNGLQTGIYIQNQGEGIFEECETFGNKEAGLHVHKGGYPVLRHCRFRDKKVRQAPV